MTSDQLELHLSESDQSSDIATNTSTEVLEGDFSQDNLIHDLEEYNQSERESIPSVEVVDSQLNVIDNDMDNQELFQEEEADEYVQQFSPVIDADNGDEPDVDVKEASSERNLGESCISVPQVTDQEAEDYVRQFSPDIQADKSDQEAHEHE